MAMTAMGRYPVFLPVPNPNTSHTHQRSGPPSTDLISQGLQGPGHTARSIGVVGGFRDLSDHLHQIQMIRVWILSHSLFIVIESTTTDAHHPAQHGYRVDLLLLGNELNSQLDSFAKKAAAFNKISRSILSLRFSSRRRLTSS